MKIVSCKEPILHNPFLISGLPGVGYVAKLLADYLREQLNAQLFEEVYSPSFPPFVLIKEDGTVDLLRNEFYFWKNESSLGNDLIIFTGNAQAGSPEGQFEIVDEVLRVAEKFSVSKIFSLAAYVKDERVDKPKVFGAVTEPGLIEYVKSFGVSMMDGGSISGTNGLLFGHAKTKNISSICLLGETMAFATPSGKQVVDAKAAKAVLEVLIKMLNIEVNMVPLEEQAKQTEELLHKIDDMARHAVEEMRKAAEREVPKYYV
ncbi:MAG: uncharacterized protein QG670_2285 [Thermoproteota archaeon]|nr:uncharacterized protein [Thermoproteota archaeon]